MATLADVTSVCLFPSVFDEYLKTTGKPIEASIRGELSGDFEKLMLAVGTSWGPQRSLGCHPRIEGIGNGFRGMELYKDRGRGLVEQHD